MKQAEITIRISYIVPESRCVEVSTESAVLTTSGDIDDVPWED